MESVLVNKLDSMLKLACQARIKTKRKDTKTNKNISVPLYYSLRK